MTNWLCEECGVGRLQPATWESDFKHGDGSVHVAGLECYRCDQCGADPVFTDQIRRNQLKITDARRRADGLLVGGEIRSVRDHLGLTQERAAMLFGGGANAFSEYERGDVRQSVAMDRLLKAAAFLPGVFGFLEFEAGLRDVDNGRLDVSAYQDAATCNMADKNFNSRTVRGNVIEVHPEAWTRTDAA
jgi:HTH-type transcriptional regulator/antitoxin MqsA